MIPFEIRLHRYSQILQYFLFISYNGWQFVVRFVCFLIGIMQNILVFKITRSGTEQLDFNLPDFDSITTALPAGLYTTFRTYAGRTKVIGLRAHLDRLYLPARVHGIAPAIRRPSAFREVLAELLGPMESPEARVRLILDTSAEPGIMYVLLQAMQPLPPEIYLHGVRAEISRSSREKPALKQTAFISESAFDRTRLSSEVFEVLLTSKGRILEGMTSNFFYVRDGALCTAGRGVLIGVTRQMVLALAKQQGIKICFKAIALSELSLIEESFITSSSRGIVPVVQIGEQPIADGHVGETTRRLMRRYEQQILSMAEDII
jgi:branched-chain amino acid aminotransferase